MTGVAHWLALGNIWRQNRIIPEGADLVEHPDEQGRGRRSRLGRGVGQPGVHGNIGALTAKAKKKPGRAGARRRVHRQPGEFVEEEAVGPPGPLEVHPDDGDEHDEPAEQGEQEELRRVLAPRAGAEGPDEEVHRDEHRLKIT